MTEGDLKRNLTPGCKAASITKGQGQKWDLLAPVTSPNSDVTWSCNTPVHNRSKVRHQMTKGKQQQDTERGVKDLFNASGAVETSEFTGLDLLTLFTLLPRMFCLCTFVLKEYIVEKEKVQRRVKSADKRLKETTRILKCSLVLPGGSMKDSNACHRG